MPCCWPERTSSRQSLRGGFAAAEGRSLWPFPGPGADETILASPELAEDERFGDALRAPLAAAGYRSLLCAPVAGGRDQAYAVAVVFREARAFTDEDILLTRHLSGAAGGALERSELFEGERRARTFAQRLAGVGALLSTSLDPAVVAGEVVREAPELLAADAAVLRLLEGDDLVVRAAAGPGNRAARRLRRRTRPPASRARSSSPGRCSPCRTCASSRGSRAATSCSSEECARASRCRSRPTAAGSTAS